MGMEEDFYYKQKKIEEIINDLDTLRSTYATPTTEELIDRAKETLKELYGEWEF